MTLRKQTFSGVRWTTFSSLGRAVLQVAQVAILARLLAPADFGLIAIAVALMAFLQIFADAGVSNAIIHFSDITQEQLSSLYWLNVGVSGVLAALLIGSSQWVADWYQEPVLRGLLMLAAITMVASSLGQQLRIQAQKELRFSDLAKLELVAALFGFASAVGLAWYGAGVYALAAGSLVAAVMGSILAWLILAQGWRPQWHLRFGEIQPFLKFGGYMIGNNLATTFNNQIDVLLGARLLGVEAMGLFSVPKNLTLNVQMIINPIVTKVGLPVMAKVQHDAALLKRVYVQTLRMTSSVNFPIYIYIWFFAPEIVHLMLGDKWQAAIPLLQIFACWGLLRSIYNPVGSILYATGKAKLAFKWNMALLLVIGPAIWAGSQFGVQGIAFAMTALMACLYLPTWYFLVRPSCGPSLVEYTMPLFAPLTLSILAGIASHSIVAVLDHSMTRLLIGLALGGLIYVGLSWRFNRDWVNAMMETLHVGSINK
ncbi:MAG TPA: MOP flippase family protein [Gammaproteobacteria bacterium]